MKLVNIIRDIEKCKKLTEEFFNINLKLHHGISFESEYYQIKCLDRNCFPRPDYEFIIFTDENDDDSISKLRISISIYLSKICRKHILLEIDKEIEDFDLVKLIELNSCKLIISNDK